MSPQHCTPCPPCQSCTKVKTSSLSSSSCFDVFSTSWIWRPEEDFPRYMDWMEQYHCLPSLIRLVPWPIRLIFCHRHHEDYFFSRNRSFYFVSSSSLINVLRSFHVRLLFGGVTAVIRPESTRDHHPIRDLDVIYVISPPTCWHFDFTPFTPLTRRIPAHTHTLGFVCWHPLWTWWAWQLPRQSSGDAADFYHPTCVGYPLVQLFSVITTNRTGFMAPQLRLQLNDCQWSEWLEHFLRGEVKIRRWHPQNMSANQRDKGISNSY